MKERLLALLLSAGFGGLRLLPIGWASALGGGLGRLAGRVLGRKNERVRSNLAHLGHSESEARRLAGVYWSNIGRVMAEYAHLDRMIAAGRVELVDAGPALEALAEGKRLLFFSLHLANWEVAGLAPVKAGAPSPAFYKPLGNPRLDALLARFRQRAGIGLFPKSAEGARAALNHFREEGGRLAMLIDERSRGKIRVPTFGAQTDTATLDNFIRIALRHDCVIVPARTQRAGGARFHVIVEPPIDPQATGDRDQDAAILHARLDAIAERWVRERPQEWLWLQFWTPPVTARSR